MISKCQNIVINRTKFSEFEPFVPSGQSPEGLKLVGFVESVDLSTGETIRKNVSVEYPSSKVTVSLPENSVIPNLNDIEVSASIISFDPLPNPYGVCLRINSGFEGETVQLNFTELDLLENNNVFFDTVIDEKTYKTLNISFDRYIPTGKEIKILFKNFPISIKDKDAFGAIRLLDYSKDKNNNARAVQSSNVLFKHDEGFDTHNIIRANILITCMQTLIGGAVNDTSENRKMVATQIELID
jgi:hypothetical protein